MVQPEFPMKLKFIEYVPEGIRLTQWDLFSCFEFRWMKGVHLICGSGANADRTNLRMYFEHDRSIWSVCTPDGDDNAGQINMMNALIEANNKGAFD